MSNTIGSTASAGFMPALNPVNVPRPNRFVTNSANMLRAVLRLERNSRLKWSCGIMHPRILEAPYPYGCNARGTGSFL